MDVAARRRAELLDVALPGLELRAEQAGELDADELQEVAVLARSLGGDPAAAVHHAVRSALRSLAGWEQDLQELAAEVLAAEPDVPLDAEAAERGRALDADLARARAGLLEAVAAYHHGSAGPVCATRCWTLLQEP